MAVFKLGQFGGLRPRASDIRLDESEATAATDVDLRKGLLRPRGQQKIWVSASDPSVPMVDAATPQTLFRFHRNSDGNDLWLYWATDVDVAPGPVDSADQRHYYTGDGIPKMFTASSVDDTTPPYPETADTKYPFTWYALGVPSPASAPVVDADEVTSPSEGSVGLITSVAVDNLIFNINGAMSNNSGITLSGCGEDGRHAGVGIANVIAAGGGQNVTCLRNGTRMRVTEVVDTDHVKVVAAGRTGPIEDLGLIPHHSNWYWDNGLPEAHKHSALTRTQSTAKRKSFILLPDEATVEVDNHVLRVNDIIRITGSTAPMTWPSTPEMVTSPVVTDLWANVGFRVAIPDVGDIEFEGAVSFAIERDGEEIDPVVPVGQEYSISSRAYTYTYVTALGEESAPSPPSDAILIRDGDEVTIESFAAPPTERRNIDRIWIYRSNTGTDETAFQYVGEVLIADIASGFVDNVPDDELAEVLETEGWDVPRADMHSIVSMPNGIMVGLSEKRVCFSVPNSPHAWPRDYEQLIDFEGVGLEVFGNSVYIATKGKPYTATGTHPMQMSLRRVDTLQPCIDKRSLVNTGSRILYCSPEGLISGGNDGFYNVTAQHFTKDQWAAVVGPDGATARALRAWYFDNQAILLTTYTVSATTTENKLVFDFRDEKLQVTRFTEPLIAAYADPETSELYYTTSVANQVSVSGTQPANSRQLLRWDYHHPSASLATGYSEGDWKSKVFRLPSPMALSCARVLCRRVPAANSASMSAHGQVLLTVHGRRYDEWPAATTPAEDDIVLIDAQAVIDGQPGTGGWAGEQRSAPFRIVPNVMVDALSFEVHAEGPVEIEFVHLGETMLDLVTT